MDTLKDEIDRKLESGMWDKLTDGIGVPDIENEAKCGCRTMRAFMNRFDAVTDHKTAKSIFTNVRHGLKQEQFATAKEKFAKYNDIDAFLKVSLEESIQEFTHYRDTGEDFYGQPITSEVLNFLLENPSILASERKGSKLYCAAFPFDMVRYLQETDLRKKRYYACHCPFARESILSKDGEVSGTLCLCSLGHVKIMWDTIFDRELDGEVIESVLGGGMMCRYVISLPEDIVARYTSTQLQGGVLS
jgi:hypothetical protein